MLGDVAASTSCQPAATPSALFPGATEGRGRDASIATLFDADMDFKCW
jgi:hypothetical protein